MFHREMKASSRPNDPCWCGSGLKFKRCHQMAEAPAPRGAPVQRGRVGPSGVVPPSILRPDYAETGRPSRGVEREVKSPEVLARIRAACKAAAVVLEETAALVKPGVTTEALDAFAHERIISLGCYPSPLNYNGFPKSICTSVNEVVCHGIPDDRPLADADIVNLDVTVYLDGVHGDCSATHPVGTIAPDSEQLLRVTRECLDLGIGAVKPGRPFSDIGRAIETHARRFGYGVVRDYCGHGIGERFHTSLQIPHYFDARMKMPMEPGMVFTVEPMISMGSWECRVWDDGWTAVTADGKRSAQYEHTILVLETGAEILTRR